MKVGDWVCWEGLTMIRKGYIVELNPHTKLARVQVKDHTELIGIQYIQLMHNKLTSEELTALIDLSLLLKDKALFHFWSDQLKTIGRKNYVRV